MKKLENVSATEGHPLLSLLQNFMTHSHLMERSTLVEQVNEALDTEPENIDLAIRTVYSLLVIGEECLASAFFQIYCAPQHYLKDVQILKSCLNLPKQTTQGIHTMESMSVACPKSVQQFHQQTEIQCFILLRQAVKALQEMPYPHFLTEHRELLNAQLLVLQAWKPELKNRQRLLEKKCEFTQLDWKSTQLNILLERIQQRLQALNHYLQIEIDLDRCQRDCQSLKTDSKPASQTQFNAFLNLSNQAEQLASKLDLMAQYGYLNSLFEYKMVSIIEIITGYEAALTRSVLQQRIA